MYVRKKRNRSGSTSVVVVSKQSGRYKEVHVVGTSSEPSAIDAFYQQGLSWVYQKIRLPDIFDQFEKEKFDRDNAEYFLGNIENVLLNGTILILNQVFKLTGFDRIEDPVLRQLVVSRICQPLSKAATVDYLKSHFDEDVKLYQLYEYLDKLHDTQKEHVEQISVEHTRKILGGAIGLVFKELERILKSEKINISVDKVLEIAKTITTIRVRLPHSNTIVERTMLITAAHKSIACLFDENFWRRRSEAK